MQPVLLHASEATVCLHIKEVEDIVDALNFAHDNDVVSGNLNRRNLRTEFQLLYALILEKQGAQQ